MVPYNALVILSFILAEGNGMVTRTGAASDAMPKFEESPCMYDAGDICIKVSFPNGVMDILILTQMPKTSIYEGFLQGDKEVGVVMIDAPRAKTRMINFNSENVPGCSYFDVDLITDTAQCIRAVFNDGDAVKNVTTKMDWPPEWAEGDIVPLESFYEPTGIPLKVLFTFDSAFSNDFDGEEGKSADEHMDAVIALVKNAFNDKSLKTLIGTTINIIATKKKYNGDIEWLNDADRLIEDGDDYDIFSFISSPGAGGRAADIGSVCRSDDEKSAKKHIARAYGPNQCEYFNPPEILECTPTRRITLTSELVAHEMGHLLGMVHDFVDGSDPRVYRQYGNEDCRGLMDYVDDGVGWSKCSARDFSRYITSGGSTTPCIQGTSECENEYPDNDCDKWTSYCTEGDWIDWMAESCKKSCSLCNTEPSECENEYPDNDCDEWTSYGDCTAEEWIDWMAEYCKKSCSLCATE